MPLHLTVADHLVPLADRLAVDLARVPNDPFEPQLVVIPGEGVRAWLVAHLAHQQRIVANIEFIYPAQLVQRAVAGQALATAWDVEPLAWAVDEVLLSAEGGALGRPAELSVARAIADRFDRYALHRPSMIHAWERGHDVGANGSALAADQRWQPRLWRLLVERIGRPSNVGELARAAELLHSGQLHPDLPGQVHVFGITGMPAPHLSLLAALSTDRHVHVMAPTPSLALWERLAALAPTVADAPLARSADPSAAHVDHPLARTWSMAPRESLLLLAAAGHRAGASFEVAGAHVGPDPNRSLLGRVQDDLRHDRPPPHDPRTRPPLDPDDRSVVWHRCHGPSRQVEVLRDELLHLLNERDETGRFRYHPRDIAILCPDVAAFAPLVHAAFAGPGEAETPGLPLRVADRSLRSDLPLLDAVGALLELLEGRYRASDVLSFAELSPVRCRFGFDAAEVGLLAEWAEATNIRWGLDQTSHDRYGLPDGIHAYSWAAGLDQLLLGSALTDGPPRLGPGHAVPLAGIEGDHVVTLGKLADLVAKLRAAHTRLTVAADPSTWCQHLATSAHELFEVDDSEAWHWDVFHRLLERVVEDARVGDDPVLRAVPPDELARQVAAHLGGLPGRARFGTGAITLSSLVALRGVPHRVICLLGLDADLGGGHLPSADDLMASDPQVGDRDAQRELRALLLDALLAAGERLVLCSTGRDLRTNAEVPPAVPLAELVDLIDATVCTPSDADGVPPRASQQLTIDHPRQAWSERNFMNGELGRPAPFSYDRGALTAALVRRHGQRRIDPVVVLPAEPPRQWNVDELVAALEQPPRSFLRDRLGVAIPGDGAPVDDLVPVALDSLTGWQLTDDLLTNRLAAGDDWNDEDTERWAEVRQRSGVLPPLAFGEQAVTQALELVGPLIDALDAAGAPHHLPSTTIGIDLSDVGLHGEVAGVHGATLVTVTPSELSAKHLLRAWLRLAALVCQRPDDEWSAVIVTKNTKTKPAATWLRLHMLGSHEARVALSTAVDLAERTRCSLVPVTPKTSHALYHDDRRKAERSWGGFPVGGESGDPWLTLGFGNLDVDDLLSIEPLDDEHGRGWGDAPSRVERWAHRLWGTFEDTTERDGPGHGSDG
jgi:exodeoxyribonuclease V gamma subunit